MENVQEWLQNILDRSNGPGALKIQRVQLWDLYSTKPLYNDTNLNGQTFDLFDTKSGDTGLPVNGVAGTSPLYTYRDADTNLDSPGNIPFDMFIHGLSLDMFVRQYTPGTVGSVNDLVNWWQGKQALLTDTAATLKLNDLDVDRLTFDQAPAGSGFYGNTSQGTTAALTVGASAGNISNGIPLAGNYRSYANEGPFFCKKNSTIKFKGQFGNSVLAAAQQYKPANTGTPTIFARAVLRGFRIWWAQ